MKSGLSGAKLGIFIFIGSALLVIGIFMLGNKEALLNLLLQLRHTFGILKVCVMVLLLS